MSLNARGALQWRAAPLSVVSTMPVPASGEKSLMFTGMPYLKRLSVKWPIRVASSTESGRRALPSGVTV